MSMRAAGFVMVAMALVHIPAALADTFYVDGSSASCSDVGPGSQAMPYCTISAALAAQHSPGTTIIVMPGIYREQVTLPATGAPGSPITFQAQGGPGNPVVVDGADDFASGAQWTQSFGDVWLAASVTWNPEQVFADSARLTASSLDPASLPAGSFEWVSGVGLYVNIGGGNPADHHAEVGHRLYGFQAAGTSWIVIDGFTTTRTEFAGIELTNSSQITVTHDVATFSNNYGIHADNCSAVVIGSCVTSDHLWSGIALINGSTGCTVQDNESFHNLTPNQACGIYDYGAPNNLIQRNQLHDNAYNGIFCSTGATGNVMVQNRSWNNAHQGIEDIFCTGNTHVGDVSYGNGWSGFAIEGNATGTTVVDCIAIDNNTAQQFGVADLEVDASSTSGLVSNDNLFWNTAGGTVVYYAGDYYSAVSAFSSATGQDTRTVQADPKFVNAAAGDFHLMSGSPAIDNANSGVANWPATDAAGNARVDDPATPNTGIGPVAYADRGALEYQPPTPTANVVVTPSSGNAPLAVTADGSGSVGSQGARIISYRFDFGDGTIVGPQTGPTAAHTYAVGNWTLTLIVTDSLGTSSATSVKSTAVIHVTPANQAPTVSLVVTPSAGSEPLAVTADGSGSVDPEGGRIASYRFDFGDGTVVGPQPGAIATHTYATGNWTVKLTVTDSLGAAGSATAAVAVAPDNHGTNLAANGSFETDSSGWAPVGEAALLRAAGGFDGGYALMVTGTDTTSFGATDSPDFIQSTQSAGTQYRFTAWVRSPSSHGVVRLSVRETYNDVDRPLAVSEPVTLSATWNFITLDYVAYNGGADLDLQILDQPVASAETLLVDAVTIIATAPTAGVSPPSTVAFAPRLTPNPLRTNAQLAFGLARPTPVRVRVFDLGGRLVRTLSSGGSTGRNVMTFDGRADSGVPLRSGVYLYEIRAGSQRGVGRFVVMR